jgi:hypothetical protein
LTYLCVSPITAPPSEGTPDRVHHRPFPEDAIKEEREFRTRDYLPFPDSVHACLGKPNVVEKAAARERVSR